MKLAKKSAIVLPLLAMSLFVVFNMKEMKESSSNELLLTNVEALAQDSEYSNEKYKEVHNIYIELGDEYTVETIDGVDYIYKINHEISIWQCLNPGGFLTCPEIQQQDKTVKTKIGRIEY